MQFLWVPGWSAYISTFIVFRVNFPKYGGVLACTFCVFMVFFLTGKILSKLMISQGYSSFIFYPLPTK